MSISICTIVFFIISSSSYALIKINPQSKPHIVNEKNDLQKETLSGNVGQDKKINNEQGKLNKNKEVEFLLGAFTFHYLGTDQAANRYKNKISSDGNLIANPTLGLFYKKFKKNLYFLQWICSFKRFNRLQCIRLSWFLWR